MSPAAKLGQLFSITALRGLIKSLLPAAVVAYVSVGCLRRDWPCSWRPGRSAHAMLGFAGSRVSEVALEIRSRASSLVGSRLLSSSASTFRAN